MDPSDFLGDYKVKQGGSSLPEAGVVIEQGDKVTLSYNDGGPGYKIEVDEGRLTFAPLIWNADTGSLGGPGQKAGTIVQVSFYRQEVPEPLKVLYGTIIERDPDSVGAWAADDQ
ncbi:MAG TPA: hypothetical protein VGG06_14600 [Thermoanaerobaculia bacterium]|jgi:hypothetical protein